MNLFCQCWTIVNQKHLPKGNLSQSTWLDPVLVRKALRYIVGLTLTFSFTIVGATTSKGAEIPTRQPVAILRPIKPDSSLYYWKATPVGDTAQLLTLFCRSCGNTPTDSTRSVPLVDSTTSGNDLPLVAVLRDTLGDSDLHNDRLLYVWLLTYVHPKTVQYVLSAMPFLYWQCSEGSSSSGVSPLLNLTTPEHSLVAGIGRQILQSGLLDPSATPIRATSRAYRGNESDYQRLRLEQAATYLRRAPVSGSDDGLSQTELDTVLARLELRKRFLGGLVTGKNVAQVGAEVGFTQERIRSRNWEVLRQCAERTGLVFEPLKLAGSSVNYGILWFPSGAAPPSGVSLKSTWKLLNIRNPWTDHHLRNWHGPVYTRAFDENGSLPPTGSKGTDQARLIPLAVYSLEYPTAPLLLVDFRNGLSIRRHEMTQRAINDVTAGVIGISHFSNWYYYVAADLYEFVVSRHGAATNQSARLDCYSQFRAALAIDRELDPKLRAQIQRRVGSLAFNPLEGSPTKALQLARTHYQALLTEAQDGKLSTRIDNERRSELAEFGASSRTRFTRIILHDATFGAYTSRVKKADENLASVDRERRVLYQLNFLDSLAGAGTAPEVAYASDRIQSSISDLSQLMPQVQPPAIRAHVMRTLQQLQGASQNSDLQADCATALSSLEEAQKEPVVVAASKRKRASPGVAALISTIQPESAR